ncbi:MAG: BREX-1 system adenine-specific DNA-methyltransferase PglX [Fimbriimonadaceae bacterium]|nr:BREX-1 system adenine-specific DNA-methyltransferase PglX [Fimbriimonadaceae bacterium]
MTLALDHEARSALDQFIQRARRLLEDDLAREAEGRFGIHIQDGQIEDEDGLHLDPTGLAARRDITEVLEYLRREEGSGVEAAARLIREAAFTHLNRLIAIRIAESIDLLPESLAKGPASEGYRQLVEVAPLLAHDSPGGYWTYLRLCGDELAADLPQLFDPRNPLLELAPTGGAIDDLVEMIGATELGEVWAAPDALGWAYQFFNSADERRAMREQSASPRTSRELAVRNQFFTPRYVVDFLVQNALGRRLLEADPTSALLDRLPLLIDPPTVAGQPLALDEVRVLDPACGSGHFLLGAYDILEAAWELKGVSAREAAPQIISALWGIDIDARCAQVAAAAIIFRARRHCTNDPLPPPNIITARALPEPAEGWDAVLAALSSDRRQLVTAIRDALKQASVLGSLLKAEELIAGEIRSRIPNASEDPSTLFGFDGAGQDVFAKAEKEVLDLLQRIADSATSGPAERLFAAEAKDAIRFVEAMRQRYDAVLMNPPFGEPVADTKEYLKAAYPWIPTRDYNLLAAFVGRGLELCNAAGRTGAITSRAGLFQITFEPWREHVLLGHRLLVLADLGYGVMEQAMVEAAAYVIGAERGAPADVATFIRLLRDRDREKALDSVAAAVRTASDDPRIYQVQLSEFDAIPSKPLAYWMTDSIRRLFRELPSLEGNGAEARVGLQSGDDFRFVRTIWEVDPKRIATSREDTRHRRWAPFAKGGEYSPYWADINLVIDWENDGERVREYPGSRPQNLQYFFRPGLTWPDRATTLAPRILPQGCVFSHVGMGLFPLDDPFVCLAWLNSRLARALADLMVSGREEARGVGSPHYYVGVVQRVPWPKDLDDHAREKLAALCTQLVQFRRSEDESDETTRSFIAPVIPGLNGGSLEDAVYDRQVKKSTQIVQSVDAAHEVDGVLSTSLKISDDSAEFLDDEAPVSAAVYPRVGLDAGQRDDLFRLVVMPMSDLVKEAVDRCGGSRSVVAKSYVADRRIELIARVLRVHPAAVLSALNEARCLPPDALGRSARDLLSYLLGCAFGRWDVRAANDIGAAGDPFAPLLLVAPGALKGADGLPVREPPSGYPLQFPLQGILVDEPGYRWDLVSGIESVIGNIASDGQSLVAELTRIVGRSSLRDYLRRDFFKNHLAQYTASRRKAPIYWPLTVPSARWGVWVYAPSISRETLYAVSAEALRRESHASAEITRLERDRASGGGGRSASALDRALDAERSLAEELRRFREEAERVAALGWEPNLDDGIALCAAPLADLFPAWRELAQLRQQLRAGKYDWATVARWANQL